MKIIPAIICEKIYDPETLNTNHLTLSVLKEQGIDGAFLAREIPLKEKQMIGLLF